MFLAEKFQAATLVWFDSRRPPESVVPFQKFLDQEVCDNRARRLRFFGEMCD